MRFKFIIDKMKSLEILNEPSTWLKDATIYK